jgi:hypothetical protein
LVLATQPVRPKAVPLTEAEQLAPGTVVVVVVGVVVVVVVVAAETAETVGARKPAMTASAATIVPAAVSRQGRLCR